MTPEGRVKAKVSKWLKSLGDDCWPFMPVQSGFGRPALDYVNCIRGVFVSIETKKPGGELTPTQQGTKAAILAAGGIVLVIWDDESLNTARKIIDGLVRNYGLSTKAHELYEQHLRAVEQGKTPASSTGRHHGASRKASS